MSNPDFWIVTLRFSQEFCGATVIVEVESWIDPGPEEMCVGILCDDCAAQIEARQDNEQQ
jgi:hypothetical protein